MAGSRGKATKSDNGFALKRFEGFSCIFQSGRNKSRISCIGLLKNKSDSYIGVILSIKINIYANNANRWAHQTR